MKKLVKDISFKEQDGKLAEMFSSKAEKMAKLLNDKDKKGVKGYKPDISTTQYRKFYEKILELNEKANALNDEKAFKIKILPFVKMLNSKVEYSKERKVCGEDFVTLMSTSIKEINSAHELKNFKYLLEAIIGYMPRK